MRIYSMTATFGKLEHQTLTLEPGLNIIEAPNEWGKSTWCAFLAAMLYGIDTRPHSTKTALVDKERYAPWSGSPMAGRMDLCWQGRDITIERKTRGRAVFGDFRAYETASGLPVPELSASNCGQVLLGVERSVFLRAGFLRLSDLPVTQDESLRRRLNALVTTGDESGAADRLAPRLRELQNRCRFNRSGLLPQAQAQEAELAQKLHGLESLRSQAGQIESRLALLDRQAQALENHLDALRYAAAQENRRRVAAAEAAVTEAKENLRKAEEACRDLPSQDTAQQEIQRLRDLQQQSLSLHACTVPQAPLPPDGYKVFQGLDGEQALAQAEYDAGRFRRAKNLTLPVIFLLLGLAALGAGIFLLRSHTVPGWALILTGAACLGICVVQCILRRRLAVSLQKKYGSGDPRRWLWEAEQFSRALHDYSRDLAAHRAGETALAARREALARQLRDATAGEPLDACMTRWQQCLDAHSALAARRKEYDMAFAHAQALRSAAIPAKPPKTQDTLLIPEAETHRLLSDIHRERRQLQLRLGQVMGAMEQLGSEEELRRRLEQVRRRIAQLEDTYHALVLAQQTLTAAQTELQRRFAPRITKQARELFSALTEGRYDRLTLDEAMNLQAASAGEDTLRQSMWRSDGTVDQLYLALRLAVARELTPLAPLVLDDALVRFDDRRLKAAMQVLRREAESKQVILFTCQSREKNA